MINFLKGDEGSNTNKAIVFSMAMSMAAKVLNFGQSMVVSYAFGTNESTDLLFYCLSMVIMFTAFQGAINQQVVVPVSIDLRKNGSRDDSMRFVSYIYLVYMVIGVVAAAVLLALPETLITFLSQFSKEAIRDNLTIVKLILPSLLLIILNTYMLDILISYRYFTFPMLLDMLKNLVIIMIVLGFKDAFREESLAIGILVGNLAQFFVLNTVLIVKIRFRLYFKRYKIGQDTRRNMAFVVIGRVATLINDFIMIYVLSGFSPGIFSAMDYAFRIETVITMVIVNQITTVIGIKIIELHSEGDFEGLKKVFRKYLEKGLFFVVPICFIVSLNAGPIISILFERGSFTGEDAAMTSMFLRYFALAIPLDLINGFVVALIIAKQIQRKAFKWQVLQSVINIPIVWFATANFGYKGYPIAVMVSMAVYIVLLVTFFIRAEFGYIGSWAILKPYLTNMILNLAVFLPALFISGLLEARRGFAGNLLYITIVSLLYAAVFIGVSYLSGVHRNTVKGLYNGARSYIRGI